MDSIKFAAIDLGTVSSRMLCVEMRDGAQVSSQKRTVITDLGEGVDANGVFAPQAIERVVEACEGFVREAAAFGATHMCTTLTSAARDVTNGEDLLARLRSQGLDPQVISGDTEARLTFCGVAHDFAGERIAVADSGGGSTELVVGSYVPGRPLELECARSLNVGCRRVTERFFSTQPPLPNELDEASEWAHAQFEEYWSGVHAHPDRLVAVGGTVTSLVAMVHELRVYDSHFVHLHELTLPQVDACIESMSQLSADQIARLPGIQPKRAPVIFAGAVIIRELMRAGGYDRLTVSENSLLAGVSSTVWEAVRWGQTAIGWVPALS